MPTGTVGQRVTVRAVCRHGQTIIPEKESGGA